MQSAKVYLRSNDSLRENTSQIAFVADGSCANSQYRRKNAEVCSDGLLQNALTARVQRILFENIFAGRENSEIQKMGGKNLTFPAEKQRFAFARHSSGPFLVEYKLQSTNYKKGTFRLFFLSGTQQGEKDKVDGEFCLFLLFRTLTKRK